MSIQQPQNLQNAEQIIEQIRSLESDRNFVLSEIESQPERMRGILEAAVSEVDTRISTVLGDEITVQLVGEQEQQFQQDASELQKLVDMGIISEEKAEEELSKLALHDDYSLLRLARTAVPAGNLAITGVVAPAEVSEVSTIDSTEDTDPTETDLSDTNPDNTEIETEKTPAKLNIITRHDGSKVLKVGMSRGKRRDFSSRNENQTDYTEQRQMALEMIVAAGGEVVKSVDISKAIKDSGFEFIKHKTSQQIKSWLDSIIFYGDQLVEHVGTVGSSAGYRINPSFDASIEYTTLPQKKDRKTTTEISKKMTGNSKSSEVSDEKFIEEIQEGTIPLRESAVFTTFLLNNSDLLMVLGITSPDPEMVSAIDRASLAEETRTGKIDESRLSSENIEEERALVARQFRAIFSNEELFSAFVDNISEGDVLEPLADYLIELDDTAWDSLLNQVLKAKVSTSITEISNGKEGTSIRSRINTITLPNGRIFKRETLVGEGKSNFYEYDVEKRDWNADELVEIHTSTTQTNTTKNNTPKSRIATSALEKTEETPTTPTNPRRKKVAERRTKEAPQWEIDLKKAIGETLKVLEDEGLIFEGELDAKRIGKISNSTKMATLEAIKRLESNGRKAISKPSQNPHEWTFDLPSVVTMSLQNSFTNIFDSVKRRRRANSIIDSSVSSFMAEWKKRITQE